jgi:hypothetical protein
VGRVEKHGSVDSFVVRASVSFGGLHGTGDVVRAELVGKEAKCADADTNNAVWATGRTQTQILVELYSYRATGH